VAENWVGRDTLSEQSHHYVTRTSSTGTRVFLQADLVYRHEGEGWLDPDNRQNSMHVEEYRASVGLATSNVVVEGDYYNS
jgi:hypothetical protein